MRRGLQQRVLAATVTAGVLLPVGPALAGGWWSSIQLDAPVLAIGEEATATAHVMFDGLAAAADARVGGDFHAYLVRGFDRSVLDEAMQRGEPHGWWERPDEVIHLGEVELSAWNGNLATAAVTFEVPAVPEGVYDLMFCTSGCAEALADLIPTLDVHVTDDVLAAQAARDVRDLTAQVHTSSSELDGQMTSLRDDLRAVERGLVDVAGSVAALETSVADVGATGASSPAPASGGPLAAGGWFLAGIAVALAVSGRRRRPVGAIASGGDDEPVPAETGPAPEFVTSR